MSTFSPPTSLLVKLGSIAAHARELIEPGGHEFDVAAIKSLLTDPEVAPWLKEMDDLALLPVKR